ncbi:MAG TPA: hypothetical protein VEU27_15605, partial [Gemmatimonadales bacterium]|nr:hypothetical protein [Gemmatimonadales bacterium]
MPSGTRTRRGSAGPAWARAWRTGDAGGQNMVGRATFAACGWIVDHAPGVRKFYLESNFATDKKASYVNLMRTRGKRVTAEAVFLRAALQEQLR